MCWQASDVADFLLHETTVSWLRSLEERTRPVRPWEETLGELEERLQQAVCWINQQYDVRALCMGVLDRLRALGEALGDRLPK